jgi:hypothetical protein
MSKDTKTSHTNEDIRKLKQLKKPQGKFICLECKQYGSDMEYKMHLQKYYNGNCPDCEEVNSYCCCHDKYNCRCKIECVCLCKNENKGVCEKECICECICNDDCKTYCLEKDSLEESENFCKCECHIDYIDMAVDCMNADLNDP